MKCLNKVFDVKKLQKRHFGIGLLMGLGVGFVLGVAFLLAMNPAFTWTVFP